VFSRHLAYHDKTQWSEYWDFLGEFCNFAEPNGLEKLEEYLDGKSNFTMAEDPLVDSLSGKHLPSVLIVLLDLLQVNLVKCP